MCELVRLIGVGGSAICVFFHIRLPPNFLRQVSFTGDGSVRIHPSCVCNSDKHFRIKGLIN